MVGCSRFEKFDIDALDEDLEGGFGGSIDAKEWGCHESGDADHNSTMEGFLGLEFWVVSFYDSHHGDGIDIETQRDHVFVDILEEGKASETCCNHECINVLEGIEEGIVLLGEVELVVAEFGMAVVDWNFCLVDDMYDLDVGTVGEGGCDAETYAVGSTNDEGGLHDCLGDDTLALRRRNAEATKTMRWRYENEKEIIGTRKGTLAGSGVRGEKPRKRRLEEIEGQRSKVKGRESKVGHSDGTFDL